MYFIIQRATCDILPDLFVHLFTFICKYKCFTRFYKYIYIYIYIYIYCHESGSWASLNSPPEVTRSPHGLLHYTHCCTPPQTTIPITHCTDDTRTEHTADCTEHTADCSEHTADCTDHTTYLNHGLLLPLVRVLFSILHSPNVSYLPSLSVFVLCSGSCIVLFFILWVLAALWSHS